MQLEIALPSNNGSKVALVAAAFIEFRIIPGQNVFSGNLGFTSSDSRFNCLCRPLPI